MSKSEANEKRMNAIDATNVEDVNVKTTEETAEEVVETKKRHHKTSPYERAAKLAFINTKIYMGLKLAGIVNKKLKDRVNGQVQPNGKPWNDELEIPESMKAEEEEKASVIFDAPTFEKDKPETTQQVSEENKKTEEVTEPKVVVAEAESTPDQEEEPTEMEKVLKPTKQYRAKGKKARKAAAAAAKEAAKAAS